MAGHAPPLSVGQNPGIGESSVVVEGFSLIRPLGVIRPGHHRESGIEVHLHIVICDQSCFDRRIFAVGDEFRLV